VTKIDPNAVDLLNVDSAESIEAADGELVIIRSILGLRLARICRT
jgi:hypothetical protein